MADAEISAPSSKKRAAGREISRDNPGLDDEDEAPEHESGTFKKASEEILASRRIVKVRRSQPTSTPSSNPFASIRLVPLTVSPPPPVEATVVAQIEKNSTIEGTEKATEETNVEIEAIKESEKESELNDNQLDVKTDEPVIESVSEKNEDESDTIATDSTKPEVDDKQAVELEGDEIAKENKDHSGEATCLSSFGQLSSNQNAFMGFTGTFSFGSVSKTGSDSNGSSGSLFGLKNDQSLFPSIGFGLSNNGGSSLFGSTATSTVTKSETSSVPIMHEVPIETGEENEKAVFTADSVLFEFFEGGWKERGKGELKVNVSTTGPKKARLVMRARGNYRLILNASIYPDMKLANMEKKGVTFACINSAGEGKDGLATFALKFRDGSIVEDFRAAVMSHNVGATSTGLKTPENSPKASDE